MKGVSDHLYGVLIMLVLSRRHRESVVVGDPGTCIERLLKVTVLEISRSSVRLGFEVPGHIPVNRWEVWRRYQTNIQPGGTSTVAS